MGPGRRDFLKGAAAGIGAAAIAAQGGPAVGAPATDTLPAIQLGPHKVSRLILGSNPILGYSHVSGLMSRLMTSYFTAKNIQKLLHRCLDVGINTWQASASPKIDDALATLRNGGRDVQWIFLASHPDFDDPKALKEIIRRNKPIAIVHHGGVSDTLWRAGQIEKAHDFAKRVQDLGILAGLSAHNPDVIRNAEDKGWDLDLYMTCFYRVTRNHAEASKRLGSEIPLGEVYLPGDPARMCEAVREVKRPCLGFKILAAGRRCDRPKDAEAAFKFAFQNIKPTDAVIVGMFPRFGDQPGQNAAYTRRYAS